MFNHDDSKVLTYINGCSHSQSTLSCHSIPLACLPALRRGECSISSVSHSTWAKCAVGCDSTIRVVSIERLAGSLLDNFSALCPRLCQRPRLFPRLRLSRTRDLLSTKHLDRPGQHCSRILPCTNRVVHLCLNRLTPHLSLIRLTPHLSLPTPISLIMARHHLATIGSSSPFAFC